MYVHELATELGVEPRDVIDRAALAGFGLVGSETLLTDDQVTTLRLSIPTAPPVTPSGAPGGYQPFPYDDGTGAISGPLGFAPPGSEPPPTQAPPKPSEEKWDDTPLWEPLTFGSTFDPSTVTVDSSGVHYGDPSTSGPVSAPLYEPPPPDIDLTRFREPPPPLAVPKADHSLIRSIGIGVVGLLIIVFAVRFVGESLDIIGPGSERHCTLTSKPAKGGEGIVEETVCLDGRGKEVSRETRTINDSDEGIEFGTLESGTSARIVNLEDFCQGATDFDEFRRGVSTKLEKATDMSSVGNWYDEHDGYGVGGLGTMLGSFGIAGPNPQLEDLHQYLADVDEAIKSNSLDAARLLFQATETTHEAQLRALWTITYNQC